MTERTEKYVHALRFDWLTAMYDPLIRWTLREDCFKRHLLRNARIGPGDRVLDLGCGTATLTLMAKLNQPRAMFFGLDGDPKILEIARDKARRLGIQVSLSQGFSTEMPYPNGFFDRVLSSLFFHHLTRESKQRTLAEVFRVLRPGGELHVADWGKPANALLAAAFVLVRVFDGYENTADHAGGRLPVLFREAGFEDVTELARYATVYGSLYLYRARKPLEDAAGDKRSGNNLSKCER